jgi:hypothetical protein
MSYQKYHQFYRIFQEWLQRERRFDYLRRFLTYQNKHGQGVLYFQARSSKQSDSTISFLNWMTGIFNKHLVVEVLHQSLSNNKNAFLSIMCHSDYLVKVKKVLEWSVSSFYPSVLRSMLPGFNELLLNRICAEQDLSGFLQLVDFLQSTIKQSDFCDFASIEDKNGLNFLLAITKFNDSPYSMVKFIRILIRGIPVKNVAKYLMLADREENTFMHYLFKNISAFQVSSIFW